MRFFGFIFIFLCFFTKVSAQSNNGFPEMLQEAENILYTQPQECLKITGHVIQNSPNTRERIQAYLLETGAYFAMGKFNQAVNATIEAKKLAEITHDRKMQIKTSISSIHLLNHLWLNVVAEQYYLNSTIFEDEKDSEDVSLFLKGGLLVIDAYKYKDQNKFPEFLKSLEKANTLFKKSSNKVLVNETTAVLAEIQLKATNIAASENYLQSILQNTNGEHPNNFLKMVAHNQLGKVYFLKKEYSKSLAAYQTALAHSEQLNNKAYSAEIKEGLAITYLVVDNTQKFYFYRTESDQLVKEIEIEEDLALNSIYNYINDNQTLKRDTVEKTYQRNLLILCGILTLILLTWVVLRYRYNNRTRQYERFIRYFESKEKTRETISANEIPKSLNIPKETEQAIIQKLIHFENSKQFTKQDMSLAMLASHFDTNTKYLSEIINTHKDKNFNSYINELRINYIIEKLKNNRTYLQYKISYLAEESGFSSHSSFATVFKAVTGIPPTVFIDMLKTSKKSSIAIYDEVE